MSVEVKRKPRKRLVPHEREKALLEGAIAYVSEHGFAFSTRQLADHLGVSQSLMYRYFKSKDDLVDAIYQSVYVGRWRSEWDAVMRNRDLPFEQRLERYLLDYANVVTDKDWVRIFVLSAFKEPKIPQRYIGMLKERIFSVWLDEQIRSLGLKKIPSQKNRDMAIEMIWGFHSSIFYLGVRMWIYKIPVEVPTNDLVSARLDMFMVGFNAFLERVAV